MKNNLSIVIPSHNRSELLVEALRHWISIKNANPDLEICVSDNTDNFNTYDRLRTDDSIWSSIKYKKAENAKMMDENFLSAVSMASNEYVWIFGDDDLPEDDAFCCINKVIKEKSPGIIIVNSSSFSNNCIVEKSRHPTEADIFFDQSQNDEYLSELASYTTFISSVVVKKSLWDSVDKRKYVGSCLLHVGALLDIKPKTTAYFISKPMVKLRVYSQTWTRQYFRIWQVDFPKIIWDNGAYTDKAKQTVVKKNPLKSIKSMSAVRAYGFFDRSIYLQYIHNNVNVPFINKMAVCLISMTPVFLMRALYKLLIAARIKKRHKHFSPEVALVWLNSKSWKSAGS